MSIESGSRRRSSSWWLIIGAVCLALTVAAVMAAIDSQEAASTPIGEGELFVADVDRAEKMIEQATDLEIGVRHARNRLGVEAVSLVDGEGTVIASTAQELDGMPITNPLLMFGITSGRFVALAAAIESSVSIDGVVEWDRGSILYQVAAPMDEGGQSILVHYDVSELLERRLRPVGLQPEAIQRLSLGAIFAVLGIAVFLAHSRSTRRHRDMVLESELLRAHSDELAATNAELSHARAEAERALALAEEKIRIRSEFVLMINHELRTPLTSVVTGARLIQDTELTADDRDHVLDAMVKDGARLQEIIDQILAVARIENRGLSYGLSVISLDEVCRALEDAHPAASLEGNHPTHPEVMVKTDVRTIALVVGSLADNARTHGAANVSLGCSDVPISDAQLEVGHTPDAAVFLTVTDDGPGIDPSFLPRIFEKFEKSSFSSGTGLGLYMTRLIVEALEGSIAVKTSASGTTFQISLPKVMTAELAEAR